MVNQGSSFFNTSGTSPTQQRKPPVKRLYKVSIGGVPQMDPALEQQNQHNQKQHEAVVAQTDAEIQLALKRADDRDRRRKADAKKRTDTLTERLLKFAKAFYPRKSKKWRARFVEGVLADKPTSWELTRIIKAFEATADGEQMFASALTTKTGAKEKRPAEESHRHPIYTGGVEQIDVQRAREADFDGKPPEKEVALPSEITVQSILSSWRSRIKHEIEAANRQGKKLDDVNFSFDGTNFYSLQVCKNLFELIPEEDDETALYLVYAMLRKSDDEKECFDEHTGHRRRVNPEGWDTKKEDAGVEFDKKKNTFQLKGLTDPDETALGEALRKEGQKLLAAEKLREEVKSFHERNDVQTLATSICSAHIVIDGTTHRCRLDRQHNALGSAHIADVAGTPVERPSQLSFTDEDCVRKLQETKKHPNLSRLYNLRA